MVRGRNARISRYLPGWAKVSFGGGLFGLVCPFADGCTARVEPNPVVDVVGIETPAPPFLAELKRDTSGVKVVVSASGRLGGHFRVETATGAVNALPASGGTVRLDSHATERPEVVVTWQDPRGVMGARAVLRETPGVEPAPEWQRLPSPAGRIIEAIPVRHPNGGP